MYIVLLVRQDINHCPNPDHACHAFMHLFMPMHGAHHAKCWLGQMYDLCAQLSVLASLKRQDHQ